MEFDDILEKLDEIAEKPEDKFSHRLYIREAARLLRASRPEARSSKAWSEMSPAEREAYNAGVATANAGEFICPKCGVRHICPTTDAEHPF